MKKPWLFGCLSGLALLGCYQPHLQDGDLLCAPGDTCPSGYQCYSGACWSHQPITVVDASVESPADVVVEVAPIARYLNQPCDPFGAGTAGRTDNCAAGLVCVDGNAGSTCMKRCAANSDCGDAACEQRRVDITTAITAQVCGPMATTCDPVPPAELTGCGVGVCYLSGARTVCETSSGDGAGTSCLYSRECIPGYTCAATGPGAGRCFPVCRGPTGACPGGLACTAAVAGGLGYCF